jgi:hypothetical protein
MPADYDARLAKLENSILLLTSLITEVQDANAEILERLDQMPKPKPKKPPLPYLENLPNITDISKIRAELFHNEPKQGVAARNLKVFVWTCEPEECGKHEEGTIAPFFFWLYRPDDAVNPTDNPKSCLAEVAHVLADERGALVGCHTTRKKGQDWKGTRRHINYVAAISANERLWLLIGAEQNMISIPAPVMLEGKRSENAAQRVWYWTRQ